MFFERRQHLARWGGPRWQLPCNVKRNISNQYFNCCTSNTSIFGYKYGGLWRLNATFNNISVISWRSVLLVEETGVSEKTTDLSHRWQTLSHNVVSSYTSPWTGFRTHKFSWIQIQYYLKFFMWENSGIFTSGTTLSVVYMIFQSLWF
jgi:hypothetical protein